MKNQIYFLKTCDTCKKILNQIEHLNWFELIEIKENSINHAQLEALYQKTSSYEKLFNKRAKLYKERDLKNMNLTENDFKNLILEHYTFLNRPVILFKDEIYIGNSSKTIDVLMDHLANHE